MITVHKIKDFYRTMKNLLGAEYLILEKVQNSNSRKEYNLVKNGKTLTVKLV